jgi:hypothetical protein
LTRTLATQKNRLTKELILSGVLLGNVITDIHGVAGRAVIEAICRGVPPVIAASYAKTRIKATRQEIEIALGGQLTNFAIGQLNCILSVIKFLEAEISKLTAQLVESMKAKHAWALNLLLTIPGFDLVSAATLLAEIGVNMDLFETADRLASWAGMCPGNNESAGKRKSTRTTKGNRWVKSILCEIAHAAVKTQNCYFSEKFKSLSARRGRRRAIVATGHSVLKTVFYMLKRKEHYKDTLIDYRELVVKRNASRWIKKLIEFGHISPEEAPKNRKPGRPKIAEVPSGDVTAKAPEKRKHGRPKIAEAPSGDVTAKAPEKRKPGRPKKSEAKGHIVPLKVAQAENLK